MRASEAIPDTLARLRKSTFRAKFKLGPRERKALSDKGLEQILAEGRALLAARLSTAEPVNDGKQTPMRGHPVFVAQHATATCCRSCLAKWHGIEKGSALSDHELQHILLLIEAWIVAQNLPMAGEPGLFDGHS